MVNKYIKFISMPGFTNAYTIINKKSNNPIGYIAIYLTTNEVCMSTPLDVTIWNTTCLEDILLFIENNFYNFNFNTQLDFDEIPSHSKTQRYIIGNKKSTIIKYHPAWRQYCLFIEDEVIIYHNELTQIINFIKELNKKRIAILKQ